MTPEIKGIQPFINTPVGGWKADTWYIATVAASKNNVFHRTLIYVSSLDQIPYVVNPGYENEITPVSQLYAVLDVEEKSTLANLATLGEPTLKPQAYYVAHISIKGGAPILALAFTGFLNGQNGQPGGYSMIVIPGAKPVMHPYNAFTVELIAPIITEQELEGVDEGDLDLDNDD